MLFSLKEKNKDEIIGLLLSKQMFALMHQEGTEVEIMSMTQFKVKRIFCHGLFHL